MQHPRNLGPATSPYIYDTATCILWNVCSSHVERGNRKYHVVVAQGKQIHLKERCKCRVSVLLIKPIAF